MNVPHAWKWPAVSDRIGQPSPTRHANGYDDYKSTSRKFLASKSGRERRTWAVKVIANSCLPLVEIWIIAGWMGWRLPFVSGWHRRATMEEWRIKKTMDPSLCVCEVYPNETNELQFCFACCFPLWRWFLAFWLSFGHEGHDLLHSPFLFLFCLSCWELWIVIMWRVRFDSVHVYVGGPLSELWRKTFHKQMTPSSFGNIFVCRCRCPTPTRIWFMLAEAMRELICFAVTMLWSQQMPIQFEVKRAKSSPHPSSSN